MGLAVCSVLPLFQTSICPLNSVWYIHRCPLNPVWYIHRSSSVDIAHFRFENKRRSSKGSMRFSTRALSHEINQYCLLCHAHTQCQLSPTSQRPSVYQLLIILLCSPTPHSLLSCLCPCLDVWVWMRACVLCMCVSVRK